MVSSLTFALSLESIIGMKKGCIQLYALSSYLVGLVVTLLYADFLGGGWSIQPIDTGLASCPGKAFLCNVGLILLFALQHSLMARNNVKIKLRLVIPSYLERSTYVAVTSIVLGLLIWLWQPMPGVLFNFETSLWGKALWTIYIMGWSICLLSTYLIDHFDLFGVRQAFWYGRGETLNTPSFRTPLLYKIIRHPIYLGWLLIHWSTPHLTAGRMLLAAGMSIYIFIGMYYEENELIEEFGETYQPY